MPEWDPYACQIPRPVGYTPRACAELKKVHHVIHVPGARRILEDGTIRSGLVYDESRLNRSRRCVTWLSANTWAGGSIYGNVQFTFNWNDIIKDREIHWVEAMSVYRPPAYRLLLTNQDLSKSPLVQLYDPKKDDGPLKYRSKTWYWNGDFTSEFMVEADLSLSLCAELNFIRHHNSLCRLNGPSCPDRKADRTIIGGRVMAFILGNALHGANEALLPAGATAASDKLGFEGEAGVIGIWKALGSKSSYFSGRITDWASRQSVLRGALALYGSDQMKSAKKLVSLLASDEIFEQALCEVIAAHFDFSDYHLPE